MKLLIYSDTHWSEYSSIIRQDTDKYTQRLDNLINTMNWLEEQSKSCDEIICLGDFFDKATLNDREITALSEINWNFDKPHRFIIGNHESSVASLKYASTDCLSRFGFDIIRGVKVINHDDFNIYFLPYKKLKASENITNLLNIDTSKKCIILSHNDISNLQYGKYKSEDGIDLLTIEDLFKSVSGIFVNGHLHNGAYMSDKLILNIGNITGQNFNEDCNTYGHFACIVDTDNMSIEFIENPYAFNFNKIEINSKLDFIKLSAYSNMVCTIKVKEALLDKLREYMTTLSNIVASRVLVDYELVNNQVSTNEDSLNINHLTQFYDYTIANNDNTKELLEELNTICGGYVNICD